MKYTVVGLWIEDEPPSRVAAWVEADDPDGALRAARQGDGTEDTPGEFLLAGIFEGHLVAIDQQ